MSTRSSELLERDDALAALTSWLSTVEHEGAGRLAFIGGEAGVGKTALVRRFSDELADSTRVLWGACDALFTPRPLGPLLDVAQMTAAEFNELVVSDAKPHEVTSALLREMGLHAGTVLVLEDMHWADEATLDVLRLLARRVDSITALVIATYRDDELDREHPLRIVQGELATDRRVDRLKLAPLSPAAVAELAEPYGVDAQELYRKTAGNPFFVVEALAAGEGELPQTVRDAVLARFARLSLPARKVLEAVAIAPPHAELWLLEKIEADLSAALEECLASGIVTATPSTVAFRHELARMAIEESLDPQRRLSLHQNVLGLLERPPAGVPDLARLAHHAEAAGDAEAVIRLAPAAAERAASVGAHREAAAQYERALRFIERAPPELHAQLLERYAHEAFVTDKFDEATAAMEQALLLHRQSGDRLREGGALSSLAQFLGKTGRAREAACAARKAVDVLEQLEPGRELAFAYSTRSQLCMYAADTDGTVEWGSRATDLARRTGDTDIVVHALNNIGSLSGWSWPDYRDKLEESLRLALEAGLEDHAGRAFSNLVECAVCRRSYADVDRYLEAGLEYCSEHGLDLYRGYLLACRAWSELAQGKWTAAADSASLVLGLTRDATQRALMALCVLGTVRLRRGDPEALTALDEALALTTSGSDELQRIAPVAAARAEAAWLDGRNEDVDAETKVAFDLAVRRGGSWCLGELACWRWRAGLLDKVPAGTAEPYRLEIEGEWARAAELWTEIGSPYEAALALAGADDGDALLTALDELQGLGAKPAAAIVARRLRARGARGVPRGPRPSTRENPANLTARELEVLRLIAQGLRNADVAKRLFLSEKTVDHHVSAILRKLDVHTRGEASAEAARLGLVAQDG